MFYFLISRVSVERLLLQPCLAGCCVKFRYLRWCLVGGRRASSMIFFGDSQGLA